MNKFNSAVRAALVVAFGAALTMSAMAADTTPAAASNPKAAHADFRQDMEKRRQEFFKHMADRMADRLEIKASQQSAWQAYTKALETAMTPPASAGQHVEPKTDAASIARMNADHAAEHARRLAQIADATAKFQEVLTPDQRKTFDQMAAAFMHRHHGMHHGHFGHGDREGHGEHDGHGWGHDGEHQGWGQGDHHDGGQHGGAN